MKFYNFKKNKKTVFAKNRMCEREREKRQNMGWYKGKHSKETTSGQPLCK